MLDDTGVISLEVLVTPGKDIRIFFINEIYLKAYDTSIKKDVLSWSYKDLKVYGDQGFSQDLSKRDDQVSDKAQEFDFIRIERE